MDRIRIEIVRDCDADGNGGKVVDDAGVVLAPGILDALCASFISAYGLHAIQPEDPAAEPVAVTPERNVSYRLRMFATEILSAYVGRQAADAAAKQAADQVAAAMAGVVLKEG